MALYTPKHFSRSDETAARRVIDAFGFATLFTTPVDGEPIVSHVPVLLDLAHGERGGVIGHVAGANPHAAALAGGRSFLVFQGPSGYVSPNWYTQPAAAVPTWNYVAVHVHGTVARIDDLSAKRAIVDALSARHEAGFPQPWTSDKMAPELLEKMLGHIVGFRLTIERIDAKFKLSQNRSDADREGTIAGLEQRGSAAELLLAAWMRDQPA